MTNEPKRDSAPPLPEDFVEMVSHEIRTPLTSIRASLALLLAGISGELKPNQEQILKFALSGIERMGRLVNELLDMSKIRAGRLELHRELVDWGALAREVAHTFEPLAGPRGVGIDVNIPREEIRSCVDRDKIFQVLSNLVHNAVKFTAEGRITIALSNPPGRIECSVSDTGPGISPEGIACLFTKFTQLGDKSHTGERGSGLGLTLARQWVELHEGKIEVQNLTPRGARFVFSVPRLDPRAVFEVEANRLLRLARRQEKPVSLVQFDLRNWPAIESSYGAAKAGALMSQFETLVRGSLRGESDVVLQSPGTLWLAVFPADRAEGLRILDRVRQTFKANPLGHVAPVPMEINSHLASYPQDGTSTAQLFAQLAAPTP